MGVSDIFRFKTEIFEGTLRFCSRKVSFVTKVETPYHDNDLVLTPIMSPQSGWQ